MSRWWNYWRRKDHVTKNRVESFQSIDCSWYYDKRETLFLQGEIVYAYGNSLKLFSSYVLADFSYRGENCPYKIPVVVTRCNYGGERHWFLCPMRTCNRRCKKLYFYPGSIFVCRKCLGLAYSTQNRCRLDRIIDKKWKLIRKLGGNSDFITQKPKRMHQKTFNKLQEEIWRLDELAERGIAATVNEFLHLKYTHLNLVNTSPLD